MTHSKALKKNRKNLFTREVGQYRLLPRHIWSGSRANTVTNTVKQKQTNNDPSLESSQAIACTGTDNQRVLKHKGDSESSALPARPWMALAGRHGLRGMKLFWTVALERQRQTPSRRRWSKTLQSRNQLRVWHASCPTWYRCWLHPSWRAQQLLQLGPPLMVSTHWCPVQIAQHMQHFLKISVVFDTKTVNFLWPVVSIPIQAMHRLWLYGYISDHHSLHGSAELL